MLSYLPLYLKICHRVNLFGKGKNYLCIKEAYTGCFGIHILIRYNSKLNSVVKHFNHGGHVHVYI